jgi:MoaA/NifB/PqqE/SkfB family radical SAM enzyme
MQKKLFRITIDTNPEDCNLKCIMCEEHSEHSNYIEEMFAKTGISKRRMPEENLEKIFQEASLLGVKEIIPSTMGEPLLYSGIEKIYELSKQYGIKINLTTNGTFPKKKIEDWAKIILPNTTDVKISWNGSTKSTSESIMKGIHFDKTLEKVKKFIQLRNEYSSVLGTYCRLTFQLTFLKSNFHELLDIIKLAIQIGIDRVKGHHLWAHFEEIKNLSMKESRESKKKWNDFILIAKSYIENHLLPNGNKLILENFEPIPDEVLEIPNIYECPFLEKEIWISATGNYSPCCAPDELRKSLGDFGTIDDKSISEMISSDSYIELVKNYQSKEVCKTCNMRKILK